MTGDSLSVSDLTNVSVPGGYDVVRARGFGDLAQPVNSSGGRIVVELPYSAPL